MMVEILPPMPQKLTNYQSPTQWVLSYTLTKSWCCHCYLRPTLDTHPWNNQPITNQSLSYLPQEPDLPVAQLLRADLLGSLRKEWHLLAGEVNVSTCALLSKGGAEVIYNVRWYPHSQLTPFLSSFSQIYVKKLHAQTLTALRTFSVNKMEHTERYRNGQKLTFSVQENKGWWGVVEDWIHLLCTCPSSSTFTIILLPCIPLICSTVVCFIASILFLQHLNSQTPSTFPVYLSPRRSAQFH